MTDAGWRSGNGVRRITAAVALGAVIAAGLGVHFLLPDTAATDIAGDALYAAAVYAFIILLIPRRHPLLVGAIALAWCVGIELFQLTGVPLAPRSRRRCSSSALSSTRVICSCTGRRSSSSRRRMPSSIACGTTGPDASQPRSVRWSESGPVVIKVWERLLVRGVVAIWWRDVTDGTFFNRWSALLSFVLAAIVGVPTVHGASVQGYLQAVVIGALGWVVLAALALPATIAERRLRSRPARGIVVLTTLLALCVVRTPLNDALSLWLWDVGTTGAFAPRVITNIVSGLAMFSLVAIALSEYARRRAIRARLERALAPMRTRLERARVQAAEVDEVLAATAQRLRASRNVMLARPVDFETVRAYAEKVRTESHLLEARADAVDTSAPASGPVALAAERRRGVSERLMPPPWFAVALVYGCATLPFSLMHGGVGVAALGMVGLVLIDLAGGLATRRLLPAPGARTRPILFLLVWTLAGIVVAAMSLALLPSIGMVGLVGIITIPGLAIVVSVCVDALRSAHLAATQSQQLLAVTARDVAAESARASDPLRHAVGILHGGVQGQCVILAAHADERQPTVAEVAQFRERTDDAFERMQGPVSDIEVGRGSRHGPLGSLGRVISAWRAVLDIAYTASAQAQAALRDRDTDERAAEIVTEAFVNAVKHSGARHAVVTLATEDTGRVRVRIVSPGRLPAAEQQASGIGTRNADTRIYQSDDDVVLESFLAPVSDDPSGVSSEPSAASF